NDLQNRAASRFLCGVSLTRQPKGKAEEVIKEFNKANSTFPVSEADFVLCDWLTLYCNSMVDQKKKKKTIEARAKGDTNEMSDNAQSPFENNDNINGYMDESVEPDALMTTNSAKIGQKNTSTLMKNMPKRRNSAPVQPCKQGTAISENGQDNTNDESDTLSSAFSHADIGQKNTSSLKKNKAKKRNTAPMRPRSTNFKVNDHQNVRNLEHNEQGSENGQDNTDDEPDALMTASSAFSHVDIGQENASTLKNKAKKRNSALMRPRSTNIKVNDYQNIRNLENDGTVILEDGQDNTNGSVLEPDALTTTSSALHADNGQENTSALNIRNLEDDIQGTVILEDGQDNTNGSVLEPDALMTASSADIGQKNALTLKKNKAKKRNSVPMQQRSTNIKVNDYLNVRNLENDRQSTVIPENNVRKGLRSSARKFNNIETVSKIVEDDAQDSGKKRKREPTAKKTSSHSVRA
ncbi:31775_t:CDS:10, partial [Gigaspora margarita]